MSKALIISDTVVINKIYVIRGEQVMLDKDLAELYGVETKQLKRQVRRNIERFPDDLMFEVTRQEYNSLRSQIGTLKRGEHTKYLPYAFTEIGIPQLSTVLNSKQAIMVNLQIMRVFVKMRKILLTHKDLLLKMAQIEKRIADQDEKVKLLFDYLKQFIKGQEKPRKKIGYTIKGK